MSDDRFDVLERLAPLFEAPEPSFEGFVRRRDRKRRNQRITAGVVAIAVFLVPAWIVATGGRSDRPLTPGGAEPSQTPVTTSRPFFLDLRTGEQTPLPESMSVGHDYVASPDGTSIAYEGVGDDQAPQIFVAGTDGIEVRQVTHDPTGATSPAWSPDGTLIAYLGNGSDLFVLDVVSGASTRITDETNQWSGPPEFTPDGSLVVFTGGTEQAPVLGTVPIAGGKSVVLVGLGEGLNDAGNGSLSPDGSLVTFLGGGWPKPNFHCGPCRFVANADGTHRRVIPGWVSNPAGTWSPDSTRIVCLGGGINGENHIIVVDMATGEATRVAEGRGATWFDNDTLLVDVNGGPLAMS